MNDKEIKPVRPIDSFPCKLDYVLLTQADLNEGARMMVGRYFAGLMPGMQKGSQQHIDYCINKLTARDTVKDFVTSMVSQPK